MGRIGPEHRQDGGDDKERQGGRHEARYNASDNVVELPEQVYKAYEEEPHRPLQQDGKEGDNLVNMIFDETIIAILADSSAVMRRDTGVARIISYPLFAEDAN